MFDSNCEFCLRIKPKLSSYISGACGAQYNICSSIITRPLVEYSCAIPKLNRFDNILSFSLFRPQKKDASPKKV